MKEYFALPLLLCFLPVWLVLLVVALYQHNQQLHFPAVYAELDQPVLPQRFKRHPERRATRRFSDHWEGEDARFMEAFRMTKPTFSYILESIRPRLVKEDVVGDTISAETRLAICLFRLCRGLYFYTIAELFGIGVSTAQAIYKETIRVITDELFPKVVTSLLPKTEAEMIALQNNMDFPYAFAAIDGSHVHLQCPVGETARKDYYN